MTRQCGGFSVQYRTLWKKGFCLIYLGCIFFEFLENRGSFIKNGSSLAKKED